MLADLYELPYVQNVIGSLNREVVLARTVTHSISASIP